MSDVGVTKEIVKFLMKRQLFATYEDLAVAMDVHPTTLSTNLKGLSTREGRESDFARRLAETLQVEFGELQDLLSGLNDRSMKELKNQLTAHQRLVDQQFHAFRPLNNGYIKEILDLTERLHSGDEYTLVTCYVPYEFHDKGLRTRIVKAANAGAVFRYVYPSPIEEKEGAKLKKLMKPYLDRDTEDAFTLYERHDEYVKTLVDEGLEKQNSNRIQKEKSSDPFLLSPFWKFIHLKRRVLGNDDVHVFYEARLGSLTTNELMRYWYSLPRSNAQAIHYKIMELFEAKKIEV